MPLDRLQKIIARAGIASRRKAEDLITAGRVTVDGAVVTELGAKADPDENRIAVDGKAISMPRAWTYVIINKPPGVVTTASDEFDRQTVLDLVKGVDARVFPVGRLDRDAEGLLLLTNDGDLAAALTHPAGEVPKVYRTKLKGMPTEEALSKLMFGVDLEDGLARAEYVHMVDLGRRQSRTNAWIELTVTEGRNHLVKRMCAAIGHPVLKLRRMQFANLDMEGLRPGQHRNLGKEEVRKLRAIARDARRRRDSSRASK